LEFHLESFSISDEDDEAEDWITPSNIRKHKIRDNTTTNCLTLGNYSFPSQREAGDKEGFVGVGRRRSDTWELRSEGGAGAYCGNNRGLLKSAMMTGDYAMQNVALQMGMNLVDMDGVGVKNVKTWVLRCHGCFKCVTFSTPLLLCCFCSCFVAAG